MTDSAGSNFQVTIVGPPLQHKPSADTNSAFETHQHSRGSGPVISRIDELEQIWDQVIQKLTGLADQSLITAKSEFELSEIEFHVGVEAGLSVGLVTKGDASVAIKFTRKKEPIAGN